MEITETKIVCDGCKKKCDKKHITHGDSGGLYFYGFGKDKWLWLSDKHFCSFDCYMDYIKSNWMVDNEH